MIKLTKRNILNTKNYSVIEHTDGKFYRANVSQTKYWSQKPFDTADQAREDTLIYMLNDAQWRMDQITRALGEFGWDDGSSDKSIADLLA